MGLVAITAGRRSGAGRIVSVEAADKVDRQQALLVLGLGIPWMAYTRLYF